MSKTTSKRAVEDYVHPLVMNGLSGRMLVLPSKTKKRREILLIYGQHASLERMFSLADELSRYGNVTLPDLPGFGGMETFYKIGDQPDLDTMADYLAAFVKLRFRRKRLSILGISYGFIVATRMLQKYPELTKKVDLIVSIVGLVHHEDFKFSNKTMARARILTKLFSFRFTSWFLRIFILRGPIIRLAYAAVAKKHAKLKDATPHERKKRVDFEIILWKSNDIRTYMHSINGMLHVDLCDKRVKLSVHHVSVDGDQYFDNYEVEQHMRVIFEDFNLYEAKLGAHMPTIVASAKEVAPLIPAGLRRLLAKAS